MNTTVKNNRKIWFRCLKGFLKLFIKRPKFNFLGEKFTTPALILSNHVGAKGPLKLELYLNTPFRFWGTYEMNSNIKSIYKYLSTIYFHNKKHMSKPLAKIVGFIACPLLKLFYSGLNLISTYPDYRLRKTFKESLNAINTTQNLVIFPEDSSNGYHDKLTSFHPDFVMFSDLCLNKEINLPIYLMYYKKKENTFIVDKPIMYSELNKLNLNKKELANIFCDRANELSTLKF